MSAELRAVSVSEALAGWHTAKVGDGAGPGSGTPTGSAGNAPGPPGALHAAENIGTAASKDK